MSALLPFPLSKVTKKVHDMQIVTPTALTYFLVSCLVCDQEHNYCVVDGQVVDLPPSYKPGQFAPSLAFVGTNGGPTYRFPTLEELEDIVAQLKARPTEYTLDTANHIAPKASTNRKRPSAATATTSEAASAKRAPAKRAKSASPPRQSNTHEELLTPFSFTSTCSKCSKVVHTAFDTYHFGCKLCGDCFMALDPNEISAPPPRQASAVESVHIWTIEENGGGSFGRSIKVRGTQSIVTEWVQLRYANKSVTLKKDALDPVITIDASTVQQQRDLDSYLRRKQEAVKHLWDESKYGPAVFGLGSPAKIQIKQ